VGYLLHRIRTIQNGGLFGYATTIGGDELKVWRGYE
jgi:hypothetical protein